jgi:hypothetical protein
MDGSAHAQSPKLRYTPRKIGGRTRRNIVQESQTRVSQAKSLIVLLVRNLPKFS